MIESEEFLVKEAEPRNIAETWRRLLAYFVDQFIRALFFIPVFIQVSSAWFHDRSFQVSWFWLGVCVLVDISYQVFFLKMLGATIGKMIFGLRVVNYRKTENLQWLQCFLRVLTDHFSIFFGQAFRILAFFRFDRRHVSDWVAETQVVQFKPRENLARPRVFMGTLLFLYFFISGFYSAYRLIQRSEWDQQTLTLHPVEELGDGPESGFD